MKVGPGEFDVLVLDAYSGDALPVHLLTRESMQLYVQHLRDERSILAFHSSNNHLDVRAVVEVLTEEIGFKLRSVDAEGDPRLEFISSWELASKSAESLDFPELVDYPIAPRRNPPVKPWTDEHHSLFEILGPRHTKPWNARPAEQQPSIGTAIE